MTTSTAAAEPDSVHVEQPIPATNGFIEAATEVFGIERLHVDMYMTMKFAADGDRQSLQSSIFAKTEVETGFASGQAINPGRQSHPYDKGKVLSITTANEYHAACLATKTAATVGLGFKLDTQEGVTKSEEILKHEQDKLEFARELLKHLLEGRLDTGQVQMLLKAAGAAPAQPQMGLNIRPVGERLKSKVDVTLDPLCMFSWADVLNSTNSEYWAAGDGYIEAVRLRSNNKVTGLYRVPSPNVHIVVNQSTTDFWYEVTTNGRTIKMARWGRSGLTEPTRNRTILNEYQDKATYSEIIHFRVPNALSPWYGVAEWISAVPTIELLQLLRQYKFDFFLNRGVPEFFLFLLGSKLPKDKWNQLEAAIRSTVGAGNSRKSVVMNILDKDMQIKMEKMATEKSGDDQFAQTSDNLNLSVVTAHRVPPLLAGIQVPGKLGAANELVNTLMGFQALVIGVAQRNWIQVLAKTLGSPEAGLGLKPTDFDLYTILEEIDVGVMSTVGQMRQPLAGAQAEGRDLGGGVKS